MSSVTDSPDLEESSMPSSSHTVGSGRKRNLGQAKFSEDDSDSDIEVIPCKQPKASAAYDNSRTIKGKLTEFLLWLKPRKIVNNFINSALNSLGYKEPVNMDVKHKVHRDSPFPLEKNRKFIPTQGNGSSSQNRTIPKLIPGQTFRSKPPLVSPVVNVPQKWLSRTQQRHSDSSIHVQNGASNKEKDLSGNMSNKSQSNMSKLFESSFVYANRGRVRVACGPKSPDIEIIKTCSTPEVLSSRTKLVLPYNKHSNGVNGHAAQQSRKSGFTTNEVTDKQEKDLYQMLLDSCFNGDFQPKTVTKNTQTQVNWDDEAYELPQKVDVSEFLDKYRVNLRSFKTSQTKPKPLVPRPIFKPEPPDDEILVLDDDKPFVFKEKESKPMILPSADAMKPFFNTQWIQELKQSIDKETTNRMKIVDEQNRQIELIKKKRREKLRRAEIPELPEITPEMDAVIEAALIPIPMNEILSKCVDAEVRRKDMDTLRDTMWLNDEVINFYLNLIVKRSENHGYPSLYTFNSFFYSTFKNKGYSSVRRWTRRFDLFSFDKVFVPLHLDVHWCLTVIDMREKAIRYYDSMSNNYQEILDLIRSYLEQESVDKKKVPLDFNEWKMERMTQIPLQENGYDCGMFTLKYAEYVSRDAELTFCQQNMKYFRRIMVYEIMEKKIL